MSRTQRLAQAKYDLEERYQETPAPGQYWAEKGLNEMKYPAANHIVKKVEDDVVHVARAGHEPVLYKMEDFLRDWSYIRG